MAQEVLVTVNKAGKRNQSQSDWKRRNKTLSCRRQCACLHRKSQEVYKKQVVSLPRAAPTGGHVHLFSGFAAVKRAGSGTVGQWTPHLFHFRISLKSGPLAHQSGVADSTQSPQLSCVSNKSRYADDRLLAAGPVATVLHGSVLSAVLPPGTVTATNRPALPWDFSVSRHLTNHSEPH